MQLLGCEVTNYAGLDGQYVPLLHRIQMLAGKNNSGKTALLHAVGALNGASYRKYSGGNPSQLTYILKTGKEDTGIWFFHDPQRREMSGQENVLRTIWNHGGGARQPDLQQVDVADSKGEWLPLVFRSPQNSNQLSKRIYIRTENEFRNPSDQYYFQAHEVNLLWKPMEALLNTSYVDPHRKIEHAITSSEARDLPVDGSQLAAFLQTMQGDDHICFGKIEEAFLACFPEYSKVVLPLTSNNVSIALVDKTSNRNIPIHQCGTGVEQMLVLIACILGTKNPRFFLLDEPQDFLHPFLERRLMEIIGNSQNSFLIATHSATMINSVAADQIIYVEKPGKTYKEYSLSNTNNAEILRRLGYKNSDFLFYEGVLFVEGVSDKELLPLLFDKAAPQEWRLLRDICLCDLGGTRDYEKYSDIEGDLIVQEKMMVALHRTGLPHVYLFDGDKKIFSDQFNSLRPAGSVLKYDFLDRSELENYLINANALAAAINEERRERQIDGEEVDEKCVQEKIEELLGAGRDPESKIFKQLFKRAPATGSEDSTVQGSRLLDKLYEHFKLNYSKRRTGVRIIEHLSLDPQQAGELKATLARIMPSLNI